MLLSAALSVILCLAMAGQVDVERSGIGQVNSQDKSQEVQNLKSAAEQGDSDKQHTLGLKYLYGQDLPKDEKLAAHWIGKAAAQGYPLAQVDLGHLYMQGRGVPLDKDEGFKWYKKAAEQIEYGNSNQIDYGPLILRRVAGRTLRMVDGNVMPGVGLALFSEKEHRRITTTASDENGEFSFGPIPPGSYRLLALYPLFCLANVQVKVVRWPQGGLLKARSAVAHINFHEVDACSYVAYR